MVRMPKISLILHNIRSTHNVGSIFRTAEGFGVKKIILSGYTPYPTYDSDSRLPHLADKITKQIHKTALGAESMVPFEYIEQLETWLAHNNSHDVLPLFALEQTSDSVLLQDFKPPEEFALLLGEEVNGVDHKYLSYSQKSLEIPMQGNKESFNVSVAAGIALYALTSG